MDNNDRKLREQLSEQLDAIKPDEQLLAKTRASMNAQSQKTKTKSIQSFTMPKAKLVRIVASLAASVMLFFAAGIAAIVSVPVRAFDIDGVKQLQSMAQLKELTEYVQSSYLGNGFFSPKGDSNTIQENTASSPAPDGSYADVDYDTNIEYSKTNTQVEQMDEGDIVKITPNGHIYTLRNGGFTVIDVSKNDGNPQLLKNMNLGNFYARELYVTDSGLVVLVGSEYTDCYVDANSGAEYCLYYAYSGVKVLVLDANNNFELQKQYSISGYFNTTRLDLTDNKLYIISDYYFSNYGYIEHIEPRLPVVLDSSDGGVQKDMPIDTIYYFPQMRNIGLLTISAVDLEQLDQLTQSKSYLIGSGQAYVSSTNIYMAMYEYCYNIFGLSTGDYTHIAKFDLQSLGFAGKATVKGMINDRYSMDEFSGTTDQGYVKNFDGYFRIATTYSANWDADSINIMFVFDQNLKLKSQQVFNRKDESIYSARFSGKKGFVVTFRQIDPLFTFDFSNPDKPVYDQGMQEQGVSDYLHIVEEDKYMIGVGRAATDTGVFLGVKVQLYDISSTTAVAVGAPVVFEGSWSWTELQYNPKALLYFDNAQTKDEDADLKQIFAFPASHYTYDYSWKNTFAAQGLFCFWYDESGIIKKGLLTNYQNAAYPSYHYDSTQENADDLWQQQWQNWYAKEISRGVLYGDYIYTVSDGYIGVYAYADITGGGIIAPIKTFVMSGTSI